MAAAQKLLADAGYPGGKGFPGLELWLRQESALNQAIGEAIASMLKDNLGINVQVSNKETKLFMDSLNAHKLPFYYPVLRVRLPRPVQHARHLGDRRPAHVVQPPVRHAS